MNIPNLLNEKLINNDGYMHPRWYQFFTQLITEMQNNVSNEGFVIPQKNTADTTKILSASPANPPVGKILYDNQVNALKVNINGDIKTIQVS